MAAQLTEATDKDLLVEMIDMADEVSRLAHQLDALALRIDCVIAEAGNRWSPDAYGEIELEEMVSDAQLYAE
jgi:hypothetical protein